MAMKIIETKTAVEAFRELERLAHMDDDFIFRGHSNSGFRLQSTLQRFTRGGFTELAIKSMDETLTHFLARLASIDQLPNHPMSRRTKLEYGRHYGLPSPLIDFSHSPFVALWMAFNGIRPWEDGDSAVYALDIKGLGILWQQFTSKADAFDKFRWSERPDLFQHEYPLDTLQLVEFPASWNTRMLRQLGLFVYDSLQYRRSVNYSDLEDFIDKGVDPTDPAGAPTFTLYKLVIPHAAATDVFQHLELMGISGTHLYNNHEGAVADVNNSYVFNRKTGFAHNIIVPDELPPGGFAGAGRMP
jgi:hypothetical protein